MATGFDVSTYNFVNVFVCVQPRCALPPVTSQSRDLQEHRVSCFIKSSTICGDRLCHWGWGCFWSSNLLITNVGSVGSILNLG
jgi:hypothetical protein